MPVSTSSSGGGGGGGGGVGGRRTSYVQLNSVTEDVKTTKDLKEKENSVRDILR